MNPFLDLSSGLSLPGLSGDLMELKGYESASSPILESSSLDLNLRSMTPTENIMYNAGRYTNTTAGLGDEVKAFAQNTRMPKSPYAEDPMQTLSANNALPAQHTEEQVRDYTKAASYAVKAASYFANAALTGSYDMKRRQYEFLAKQDERAAELLYKNMREITRAAQADANVYKMQGADVKSKQKVGQAASGFAVGKGVYKNMLDTTDARTNYNVSLVMLKSDLQNAEIMRKAGTYKAQAAIEKGNAKIAKIEKKAAVASNIVQGIGALANAGLAFYVGKYGLEKSKSSDIVDAEGKTIGKKGEYGTYIA